MFWSHGRHNFTFGGDFAAPAVQRRRRSRTRAAPSTFTGAATGSDFADFLLGVPDTSSIAFGNADKYLRASSRTTPTSPTTGASARAHAERRRALGIRARRSRSATAGW